MDLLKIFFGIILLRVLFWLVKGYAKQPEKLQFFSYAVKKFPILAMGPILTLLMIVMAIYQEWSFDSVIILVIFGLIINLIEDILIIMGVENFRTKDFKIDGEEVSSDTSSKSNIWLGIFISTLISGAVLFFISREVEWSFDGLLKEYWLIMAYIVLMGLISAIKVIRTTAMGSEPYDASIIFSKLMLRPIGLFFLFMMVSFLDLFPVTVAVCIFLLFYGIIGFFGQSITLFMLLPEEQQVVVKNDLKKFRDNKHS